MKLSRLPKLLPGIHPHVAPEHAEVEVTGVTHDSRRVKPGSVFVAISGHERDGCHFVEDALSRGAVAVVSERPMRLSRPVPHFVVPEARRALAVLAASFYGKPSRRMKVVGVTGTNGKTTTAWMLRAILQRAGKRCGLLGTILYDTGRRILDASITTPESVDVQEYLAEMAAERMEYASMEVSSHALCMRRVDLVHFSGAVFTNLSAEHMDYHRTISAYRDAKARLFRDLGPAAFAVLNADDKHSEYMAEIAGARNIRRYGLKPGADVAGRVEESTLDGLRMKITTAGESADVRLPFIGSHNASNALAATAAALELGFDIGAARDGLEAAPCVPGRLEPVPCERGCKVLVDFAHTDQALKSVLQSLRKVAEKRIIVVFGAGGDRDRAKRPRMGRVVEQNADLSWVTSDNPRSENPRAIIDEILAGMKSSRRVHVQPDRQAAIEEAIRESQPGDLVLIAGKGHERTQRFDHTVIPFDDREAVARAVLAS